MQMSLLASFQTSPLADLEGRSGVRDDCICRLTQETCLLVGWICVDRNRTDSVSECPFNVMRRKPLGSLGSFSPNPPPPRPPT